MVEIYQLKIEMKSFGKLNFVFVNLIVPTSQDPDQYRILQAVRPSVTFVKSSFYLNFNPSASKVRTLVVKTLHKSLLLKSQVHNGKKDFTSASLLTVMRMVMMMNPVHHHLGQFSQCMFVLFERST